MNVRVRRQGRNLETIISLCEFISGPDEGVAIVYSLTLKEAKAKFYEFRDLLDKANVPYTVKKPGFAVVVNGKRLKFEYLPCNKLKAFRHPPVY